MAKKKIYLYLLALLMITVIIALSFQNFVILPHAESSDLESHYILACTVVVAYFAIGLYSIMTSRQVSIFYTITVIVISSIVLFLTFLLTRGYLLEVSGSYCAGFWGVKVNCIDNSTFMATIIYELLIYFPILPAVMGISALLQLKMLKADRSEPVNN